ncbi:hypothetical protein HANVADRAFT_53339 [Hanseniaspora valbyensis NRRL Y-1626]|uniref:Uncharacterized protein n=1 Tax=Hanseniaspora valbyensis NRRL Y-1626 TaxID=766949 RepID=A0A1B7TBR3_9ASCO|nr:hypothetical protein HANVADRAFT_53339 [Hanseniaspora valbyensis NRRL Y-1626]
MKLVYLVCIYSFLLNNSSANTITQFIKPFSDEIYDNKLISLNDTNSENIILNYSDDKKLNEFYQFLPMKDLNTFNQQIVNIIFQNVPIKEELLNKQNSFFNKICWTPVSSVDFDDLTFYVNENEIILQFTAIPLSDKIDGFTIYISLEKLMFGLLPLSIIYLIVYLTSFIAILVVVLFFSYKKLLSIVLLKNNNNKFKKIKKE